MAFWGGFELFEINGLFVGWRVVWGLGGCLEGFVGVWVVLGVCGLVGLLEYGLVGEMV